MLVLTALAMMMLVFATPIAFAASAILLGLSYGPMNPASTVLLARYTPSDIRACIFSLKQTAVPVGGAFAGFGTPIAAAAMGWRSTVLLIASVCLGLVALIQPWRNELDRDKNAAAR